MGALCNSSADAGTDSNTNTTCCCWTGYFPTSGISKDYFNAYGLLANYADGATTGMMIPTATGAANAIFPQATAQMQPDFWANQQAQFANEQNRLEQERVQQLQQQQAQQELFQQQLQKAQQDMMNMQLQQQNQHQNDLIALTNQYEKDQLYCSNMTKECSSWKVKSQRWILQLPNNWLIRTSN